MSTAKRFGKYRKQITEGIQDLATRQAFESLDKRIREIEKRFDSPAVVFSDMSEDAPAVARITIESDGVSPILLQLLHTTFARNAFASSSQFCITVPVDTGSSNLTDMDWSFYRENDDVKIGGGRLAGRVINAGFSAFFAPASWVQAVDRTPPAGNVRYRLEFSANIDSQDLSAATLMAVRIG